MEKNFLQKKSYVLISFNVSRISVRKAFDELTHQGYIIRKHGKGSYVNVGVTVMQLNTLQGFTEEMKARGMRR